MTPLRKKFRKAAQEASLHPPGTAEFDMVCEKLRKQTTSDMTDDEFTQIMAEELDVIYQKKLAGMVDMTTMKIIDLDPDESDHGEN